MLRTESKLKMKGAGVWIEDRIVQLVIDVKIRDGERLRRKLLLQAGHTSKERNQLHAFEKERLGQYSLPGNVLL